MLRSLENVRNAPDSISSELNALKNKIKSIYDKLDKIKVIKNRSALKEYATEHKIDGIPVKTLQEFLMLTKPTIEKLLRSMHSHKVKLNLQCFMERGEGNNRQIVEANFSSVSYEIFLEGTNIEEVYEKMMERIIENFINFV